MFEARPALKGTAWQVWRVEHEPPADHRVLVTVESHSSVEEQENVARVCAEALNAHYGGTNLPAVAMEPLDTYPQRVLERVQLIMAGHNYAELARRMGVTRPRISQITNGRPMRAGTARRLLKAAEEVVAASDTELVA